MIDGNFTQKPEPIILRPNPDISQASVEQRKYIFELLATTKDENWACEAFDIDQPFSPEEIELIVSIITDPGLSFQALTVDLPNGLRLNKAQAEKLMIQIESDINVAESFLLQLTISGVAEEPNETEKWWLERLRKLLA